MQNEQAYMLHFMVELVLITQKKIDHGRKK